MRNISILGSTGSIGRQALDVIRQVKCANVVGLAAGNNTGLLLEQIIEFKPEAVSVYSEKAACELDKQLKKHDINTKIFTGIEGNIAISVLGKTDIVLNAVVGSAGLIPTVEAIKAKKDIALANKETLVAAGEIVTKLAQRNNVHILPVDSEHSAIFQCLNGSIGYEKIYLTASGGPFRGKTIPELQSITPKDALKHPNWSMGKKITIDSATLMNKGLEFIEAKWLFGAGLPQIEILIHPQSIIHSMVQFPDGALIAQLGTPDMRTPIQYALTYPNRMKNNFERLDFLKLNKLTFEKPDFKNFPCLRIAIDAAIEGGALPAVMNAANETAVARFLGGEIGFNDIPKLIDYTMSAYTLNVAGNLAGEEGTVENISEHTIEDIIYADSFARRYSKDLAFL